MVLSSILQASNVAISYVNSSKRDKYRTGNGDKKSEAKACEPRKHYSGHSGASSRFVLYFSQLNVLHTSKANTMKIVLVLYLLLNLYT